MAATETQFDDVVVGSSPLMLMQAIRLAEAGRKVALVDRSTALGGSWQTAKLDTGEAVEIACHLIEVFPEVYDLLQLYSGTRFVTLKEQPVRITRGGTITPYFNRALMMASGARLMLGWCKTRLAALLGRADHNALLNFDSKLKDFLYYQLPTFFQNREMKAPEHGFVDFMDGLVRRAEGAGVALLQHDVKSLQRTDDGRWALHDGDRAMCGDHVHLTTSTNLRKQSEGHYEATPPMYAKRVAVVVDIPHKKVLTSQSYVAFWRDPEVARISRIDYIGAADRPLRFLIEFHEHAVTATTDWGQTLTNRLRKARILKDGADYDVVGKVICDHTVNIHHLPAGKIEDGIWSLYSYGNLAAGIAAWNKQNTTHMIPPAPRVG